MASQSEPPNPFYWLLLITGLLFIATVLAYAIVPVLEQKAMDAGAMPPPSPFRDALKGSTGAFVVLGEVLALIVFGFLSMGLDRFHRWRQERASAREAAKTDPPNEPPPNHVTPAK